MKHRSLLRDSGAGLAAGALASLVLRRITAAGRATNRRSARVRRAFERVGQQVARLAGKRRLSPQQRSRLGLIMHAVVGTTTGTVYAIMRPRLGVAGKALGLGFGTAYWLLADQLLLPLLGLTRGPRAYPLRTHARSLAGHLAYGALTDVTLRGLQRA